MEREKISLADQSTCKIQSKFLVKTGSKRTENTVLTILNLLGTAENQRIAEDIC